MGRRSVTSWYQLAAPASRVATMASQPSGLREAPGWSMGSTSMTSDAGDGQDALGQQGEHVGVQSISRACLPER